MLKDAVNWTFKPLRHNLPRIPDRLHGEIALKILRKLSSAFGILLVAAAMAAPAGAEGQDGPVIRVAVEGAYPPFNYLDQSNELQGFEVDLLKALCEAMKAQCTLVTHDWDGIIRGLINREYDAIMSSLEITGRREKRIAFSRRYYAIPAAFIAQKDSDIRDVSPEALAGRKVGTTDRSEHAAFLQKHYKSTEVQTYGKLEEADLDLLTGRIDLVLGDKLSIFKFLDSREGACCRFVADAPFDENYHGKGYGVGLRKEDVELKAMFDKAIEQVMADGTYDRISAKYFGFDIK
jgi:polar amino acid transport system substrate-binding protein